MDKNGLVQAISICICVLALISGVTYTVQNKQNAMTEMVSKGADPQAVACAVDGVNSMNQQVCTALANNKSKGN